MVNKQVCIATYLPREGPETVSQKSSLLFFVRYSSLSTSRGAGNLLRAFFLLFIIYYLCIATYQPREGPETHCFFLIFYFLVYQCIATYQPREGPETV